MTARISRLASIGVLVLALIVCAAPAQAAFPGTNGKIAFQRGSDEEVFTIRPDGSGLTQLTNKPNFDGEVAWSPDGKQIAFWGAGAGGNADIFVINADGSGLTNVTNSSAAHESEPSWSPDGSRILFSDIEISTDNLDIYVMDADGSGRARLTTDPAFDSRPVWSPDGDRIAYMTSVNYPEGDFDIATMDPDGTGKVIVVGGPTDDAYPDWSPDGSQIAFSRDQTVTAGERDVWVTNLLGSGETQVTSSAGSEMGPVFSPDGTKIAFMGGGFPADLFTINLDGTGQADVTNDSVTDSNPDWQPVQSVISPYVRPAGATPVNVSLVPAYQPCTPPSIDRQHGESLTFPSCNPPLPESLAVTVGTPDANTAEANSQGRLRLKVQVGDQVPPDNSDVLVQGTISDVRCQGTTSACGSANAVAGPDYTGELQGNVTVRITDRFNSPLGGGGREGATVVDLPLAVPFACTSTASGDEGGACSAATTLDAITPGVVREGQRAVWELGRVYVTDGGADGQTETTPNTLFMTQGLFIP